MVGKLFFKTKKLLSLLSFGVLFFVAMEIWLSHKKMDPSGIRCREGAAGSQTMRRESDDDDNAEDKATKQKENVRKNYDFYGAVADALNESRRGWDYGRDQPNAVDPDYDYAVSRLDGNSRNRTDFKGGGTGVGGNDAEEDEGRVDRRRTNESLPPDARSGGGYGNADADYEGADGGHEAPMLDGWSRIACKINEDYVVRCLREGRDVFVPFSFIKKYFEISGELVMNRSGMEELLWRHSYAKVYEFSQGEGKRTKKQLTRKYEHGGVFMSFEHYRVEVRDRVKCVSAKEGVPVSKQWGAQGYFYPIQIAQFGLSHYSKLLIEPERKFQPLGVALSDWFYFDSNDAEISAEDKNALKVIDRHDPTETEVEFDVSADVIRSMFYYVNIPKSSSASSNFNFLSFEMKFTKNASVSVSFETNFKEEYRIHYVASDALLLVEGKDIYYGVGLSPNWHKLSRDIEIDFRKILPKKLRKRSSARYFPLRPLRVELRGAGRMRNLQLSDKDHLSLFYHSANWMVKYQDSKGGWPIPVSRVLVEGAMQLEPGWYSAMAQGHAMSLLSRAYGRSKNPVYLRAAYQAINPFLVPSEEGGVLAYLFDQHPWYEEYPTTPPSFVINGFMYALFGLYDLARTLESSGIDDEDFVLEDGFALNDDVWLKKFDGIFNQELVNGFADQNVDSSMRQQTVMHKVLDKNYESVFLSKDNLVGVKTTNVTFQGSQSFRSLKSISNLKMPTNYQEELNENQDVPRATVRNPNPEHQLNPADANAIPLDSPLDEEKTKLIQKNYDLHHHHHPAAAERTTTKPERPSTRRKDSQNHPRQCASLISKVKDAKTARVLFEAGLKTLKIALPLFDNGSGSFYDLRHFSVPGCPPNRARWDYHSTHISQLLMASSMDSDPAGKELFLKTIARWLSYMKGKKAPHN